MRWIKSWSKVDFAHIMQTTVHTDKFKHTRPPRSLHDIKKITHTKIFNFLSPTIYTTTHHAYVKLTLVIIFLTYGHSPAYMTHVDDES